MSNHIIINGEIDIALYSTPKPTLTADASFPRLLEIPPAVSEMASEGGEIANISLDIENQGGSLTALLAGHVMGYPATLYADGVAQFSGRVTDIKIGPVSSISLEC